MTSTGASPSPARAERQRRHAAGKSPLPLAATTDRVTAMRAPLHPQVPVQNPFGKLIGMRIDHAADGFCRSHLLVDAQHHNPHAVLHGGVLFTLADSSMGAALYTLLQPGETCTTVEMKINFMKSVRDGDVRCETTVLRRGRTTAVLESRMLADGELIAVALATYAILARRD